MPHHSKIASAPCPFTPAGLSRGSGKVKTGLGRPHPQGTAEADRCRDIGGIRERGSDQAREGRKLPSPEQVRTRPPRPACACQSPQPARLPAHMSQPPCFRAFPLTKPLSASSTLLLLTSSSKKPSRLLSLLSISEPAYTRCLEKTWSDKVVHSFSQCLLTVLAFQ